jgi:hypothetical protein
MEKTKTHFLLYFRNYEFLITLHPSYFHQVRGLATVAPPKAITKNKNR